MRHRTVSFARGVTLVLAVKLGFPAPVHGAPLAERAASPAPLAERAASPAPPPEGQCLPKCHAGFHCVDGLRCVRDCEPPCTANEICDADRRCVVPPAATEEAAPPDTSTASTAAASAAQPAPVAAGVPTASSTAGQKAQSVQSRATTSPLSQLEATPTSAQIGDPSLYAQQEPATPETEKNDSNRLGKGRLFLLSVENLVGYDSSWHTIAPTQYRGTSLSGVEGSTDSKLFTLFGGHGTGGISPQLALDRTIVPSFTIGGVFGYTSNDGGETRWTGASTTPRKNGTSSAYAIGGRIGFLFMLDEHWGIWPKVGLTYWSLSQTTYSYPDPSSSASSSETINEVNQHAILLTPAVTLVVSPVEHFAFLFGMNVPFSLGGGYSYQVNGVTVHEGDLSTGALGLSAGLLGYL